ncbi:hypothetical protein N9L66_00570 [Porticoccaceae bacterium]|nr:hypothetical protein [Porticoccaceae bacterium]MDA8682081.1 hypothetical protein [Porticoccaceae bacterium]MDA8789104.1 hypothetical protein [Porticoccaceae bacterium]
MSNVVDARSSFRGNRELKYEVTIEVVPTFAFFLAALKCVLLKKPMRIRHIFTNDPFLSDAGSSV